VGTELSIRLVALCVFRNDDKILVREYHDPKTNFTNYRPVGGTIEYGEQSEDAVKREVLEETGIEITEPRLLGVIENIFVPKHTGIGLGHNIEFIYEAEFPDKSLYEKQTIDGIEGNENFKAIWMPIAYFQEPNANPLVPDGLVELLMTKPPKKMVIHVNNR
jgi:8-oxo-dGTP pyrophosphatase MutT (NUDIX family)